MSDSLIWTLLGHLVCIAQWAAFILVDYAYLGRGRRFRHPCVWAALLALAVLALSVLCGFGFFNIKSVVSNIIYLLVIALLFGGTAVDRMSACIINGILCLLTENTVSFVFARLHGICPGEVWHYRTCLAALVISILLVGILAARFLCRWNHCSALDPLQALLMSFFPGVVVLLNIFIMISSNRRVPTLLDLMLTVGLTIAVLVHLAIVQMFNDQVVQGQASHFQAALEQQRAEALMESYTAQRRLKQAEQTVAAAEAAVDALTAQQTAAQKELPARSAEELTAQQTELTAARETLRSREKQLSAQLLPNRKTAAQYRAAAEARQTLESRWQWVSALAATAGGTLTSKQKIKLEAYIQMDYLDRILRHANLRLMQMTDAQYELERVGAENQRSQSGLDLGVIDHYNGTRRSVKTLSGGESFKASLALALGLSDEVQSAAGGIRLDTLFLDEGFGSLDEESLEQAIRVLAGLTEGDRLVGIISHVGALKDRIDRQVVVHKNRTGGSTVELVV